MRIGKNPNIHKNLKLESGSHRVIIPIYIPNAEGYFKEAFDVLQVCLRSLLLTINSDTRISLISNACSTQVNDYLKILHKEGKIDRLIFNTENVGKMNAIIPETRASFEEFITYADADVFFDKGWLKQTKTIFKDVPKAGFVSMNPTPDHLSFASSTVFGNLLRYLFSKKIKTSAVCNYKDLEHFHKSVGRNKEFTDRMFDETRVTLVKNKYIIGAGHFCCTIRKTPTLYHVPSNKSDMGVSGGSENKYLDIPFDKTGLWRISSSKAFVWHMGNNIDAKWVEKKLANLHGFEEDNFAFAELPFRNTTWISRIGSYTIQSKLVGILKKLTIVN